MSCDFKIIERRGKFIYRCLNPGCGERFILDKKIEDIQSNCKSTEISTEIATEKSKEKGKERMKSNIFQRGSQYLDERRRWVEAGKPLRSEERIAEIFEICSKNTCGQYIEKGEGVGQCGLCGCNLKKRGTLLNKISWANTSCPMEEPLWGPEEGIAQEKNKDDNISLSLSKEEKAEARKKGGCGCKK